MDSTDPAEPPPIPLVQSLWDDGIPVVMPVAHPTRQPVRPTIVAPPPGSWEPVPIVRRARRRRRPVAAKFASVVPLLVTMAFFGGMMLVSFGQLTYSLVTHLNNEDVPAPPADVQRAEIVRDTAVFEGLDTVLVLIGLLVAGRPLVQRAVAPLASWLAAAPGFVLLLGTNVAYCLVLRSLAQPDSHDLPIDLDLTAGWWGWAVLLVCVQPAVIEELFFRHLLLGHLRPHVGMHGAVWVSAVVFGMAHLGNPVGWPVLILLGVGLGYARTCSGTLALPIALHFLHNLCVLALNEAMFR